MKSPDISWFAVAVGIQHAHVREIEREREIAEHQPQPIVAVLDSPITDELEAL